MNKWIIGAIIFGLVFFMTIQLKVSKAIISLNQERSNIEIANLNRENEILNVENESLKNSLIEYGFSVTVTMYEPVRGQTDRTPNITADGSWFDIHNASNYKWVALSRDLIKRYNRQAPFKYGDLIYIGGIGDKSGLYQVKDTMNKRFRNAVDILETPGTEPYKFADAKITKVIWDL